MELHTKNSIKKYRNQAVAKGVSINISPNETANLLVSDRTVKTTRTVETTLSKIFNANKISNTNKTLEVKNYV